MSSEKGSLMIEKPFHFAVKVAVLIFLIGAFYQMILQIAPGCTKYRLYWACNADRNCRPVTREPGGVRAAIDFLIRGPFGGPFKVSAHSIGCEPCVHPPCYNFTCGRNITLDGVDVECNCPDVDDTEKCAAVGKCRVKNEADIFGFTFFGLGDYTQKDGEAVCVYQPT